MLLRFHFLLCFHTDIDTHLKQWSLMVKHFFTSPTVSKKHEWVRTCWTSADASRYCLFGCVWTCSSVVVERGSWGQAVFGSPAWESKPDKHGTCRRRSVPWKVWRVSLPWRHLAVGLRSLSWRSPHLWAILTNARLKGSVVFFMALGIISLWVLFVVQSVPMASQVGALTPHLTFADTGFQRPRFTGTFALKFIHRDKEIDRDQRGSGRLSVRAAFW